MAAYCRRMFIWDYRFCPLWVVFSHNPLNFDPRCDYSTLVAPLRKLAFGHRCMYFDVLFCLLGRAGRFADTPFAFASQRRGSIILTPLFSVDRACYFVRPATHYGCARKKQMKRGLRFAGTWGRTWGRTWGQTERFLLVSQPGAPGLRLATLHSCA